MLLKLTELCEILCEILGEQIADSGHCIDTRVPMEPADNNADNRMQMSIIVLVVVAVLLLVISAILAIRARRRPVIGSPLLKDAFSARSVQHKIIKPKWRASNVWIRDVFWYRTPAPWVPGPKDVSNPDSVKKMCQPPSNS